MGYKPKQAEKIYYSIGEVSKKFNVNPSLIRFWEKEFDIIQPFRNKKGNRLFTKMDMENFYVIYHLVKERGFTLQGAKDKMNENKADTVDNVEVVASLNKIKDFLIELKNGL
ncbi:MAG: MerR family transcriptional regulator [Bacteroidota bacterium]